MSRWSEFKKHRAETKHMRELLNEEDHYMF